jgi:hypothetical protein
MAAASGGKPEHVAPALCATRNVADIHVHYRTRDRQRDDTSLGRRDRTMAIPVRGKAL